MTSVQIELAFIFALIAAVFLRFAYKGLIIGRIESREAEIEGKNAHVVGLMMLLFAIGVLYLGYDVIDPFHSKACTESTHTGHRKH